MINNNFKDVKKSEQDIYKNYVKNINEETAKALLEVIDSTDIEGTFDRIEKVIK